MVGGDYVGFLLKEARNGGDHTRFLLKEAKKGAKSKENARKPILLIFY